MSPTLSNLVNHQCALSLKMILCLHCVCFHRLRYFYGSCNIIYDQVLCKYIILFADCCCIALLDKLRLSTAWLPVPPVAVGLSQNFRSSAQIHFYLINLVMIYSSSQFATHWWLDGAPFGLLYTCVWIYLLQFQLHLGRWKNQQMSIHSMWVKSGHKLPYSR